MRNQPATHYSTFGYRTACGRRITDSARLFRTVEACVDGTITCSTCLVTHVVERAVASRTVRISIERIALARAGA